MTGHGRPSAVVLLTGDELLQGRVRDTNGPFLSASLVEAGLAVVATLVIGDDRRRIGAALAWALRAHPRVVVLSGGLGTTHDDVTMAAVAEAARRPLARDDQAWEHVRRRARDIAARRRLDAARLEEQAARQALLPRGARCIPPAGMAPGALLELGDTTVVVLPGVPRELEAMWPPVLDDLSRDLPRPLVRLVRLHGVGEMQVTPVIEAAPRDGLDVGITAADGEIVVRVASYDEDAERRSLALVRDLQARLPAYSVDGRSVDQVLAGLLRERSATVAVAESCTGGSLGARLTSLAGSSEYFLGGVLSYADDLKVRLLGVPADLLDRYGAVSAPVAEAMAGGCRERTGADYALAVTGIAGPDGGSLDKPVGLVFVACAGPRGTAVTEQRLAGDRNAVRAQSVVAALHLLRTTLAMTP